MLIGVFFFFQAEDGIRDDLVTGVQTCALPILRPDVVLCDIGLPDIDGFEVARRIRARADLAATRLIALTGYGQAEDMRQALKAGFEAHLTKPVNLEQLMALLTSVSR